MKILDILDSKRALAEQAAANAPTHELTTQERLRLLRGRNGILYLPTFGEYGGVIPRVAEAVGVSRQYVHTTLFPDDPAKLFNGGLVTRMVWSKTATVVFDNPLYVPLKNSFEALREKGQVVVKMRAGLLRFFLKRAGELGVPSSVKSKTGTNVATYWVVSDKLRGESPDED